ncbi:hypothetical protein F7725_012438 [Dissostichus mawsoni]|uniref:Uncharacterized protein n=1 Tax=Dissostichus mawsoni TaxID=36200 RepID=A0A7J5YMC2_DISMA|nr:hypothetical protein F7725_012438 [Dissostichus mawsoni]
MKRDPTGGSKDSKEHSLNRGCFKDFGPCTCTAKTPPHPTACVLRSSKGPSLHPHTPTSSIPPPASTLTHPAVSSEVDDSTLLTEAVKFERQILQDFTVPTFHLQRLPAASSKASSSVSPSPSTSTLSSLSVVPPSSSTSTLSSLSVVHPSSSTSTLSSLSVVPPSSSTSTLSSLSVVHPSSSTSTLSSLSVVPPSSSTSTLSSLSVVHPLSSTSTLSSLSVVPPSSSTSTLSSLSVVRTSTVSPPSTSTQSSQQSTSVDDCVGPDNIEGYGAVQELAEFLFGLREHILALSGEECTKIITLWQALGITTRGRPAIHPVKKHTETGAIQGNKRNCGTRCASLGLTVLHSGQTTCNRVVEAIFTRLCDLYKILCAARE